MPFNHLTLFLVVLGGVSLMSGYVRVMFLHPKGVAVYMASSVFWLCAAYVARALYWDGIRVWVRLVDGGSWVAWSDLVGGALVNTVPNLMFALACYHGLLAMHLMIPEDDRPRYHWWNAYRYPPWSLVRMVGRLVSRMNNRPRPKEPPR